MYFSVFYTNASMNRSRSADTIGFFDEPLMFQFDFLDQPANRGDPLSAGDRTGGINIEMN